MSNRRKPTGPLIARQGPLSLPDYRPETRRRVESRKRAAWVHELACRWDVRLGRDRGCHVRRATSLARCLEHPVEAVNYGGRGA